MALHDQVRPSLPISLASASTRGRLSVSVSSSKKNSFTSGKADFAQLNSSIEKKYIQVLFVYRFLPPFGLIQAAYQRGSARFGERGQQGDMLFLKVSTVF